MFCFLLIISKSWYTQHCLWRECFDFLKWNESYKNVLFINLKLSHVFQWRKCEIYATHIYSVFKMSENRLSSILACTSIHTSVRPPNLKVWKLIQTVKHFISQTQQDVREIFIVTFNYCSTDVLLHAFHSLYKGLLAVRCYEKILNYISFISHSNKLKIS
jgi:hypothetical protein